LRWQKQVFMHTQLSRAYLALARLSCFIFADVLLTKAETKHAIKYITGANSMCHTLKEKAGELNIVELQLDELLQSAMKQLTTAEQYVSVNTD